MKKRENKSVNLIVRITPTERKALRKHCKKHKCKMADLFRPIIEDINN